MNEQELKRMYNLFTDCWRFFKKYADAQDTDSYRTSIINESSKLSEKYNNDKFAIDLLVTILDELDRKMQELKERREDSG